MTQPRFTSRGRCIALVVATGLFLGGLAPSATLAVESTDPRAEAPDESLGSNAGWGVAAFVGNLLYAPVKLLVALGGTLAGGVAWESVDQNLMLSTLPGIHVAGEMLDWEAPTGGYLLTACLATGRWAGAAAMR